MKRFRDIQILLGVFTAFFLASSIALIVVFQTKPWITASFAVIALAGTWLMVRSFMTLGGYFHAFKQREARLMLLASRDPATGLFQRNGFEWLLAKEIERAKRKDFSLTLMLIQVEPFQKIEADIGIPATERLLFQVGENLQNTCRAYDNLFKLDANTFAIFFTETQHGDLDKIIKRLQRRLQKTAFLVNSDRVKINPLFAIGAGVYPIDGTNPQSLESFARSNLSTTFDATHIRHPEKSPNDFFEVKPTVKTQDSVTTKQDVFLEDSIPVPAIDISPPSQLAPVDPQDLKGTPEMDAFQSELKTLFARTQAIESSVQKLLADDIVPTTPEAATPTALATVEPEPAQALKVHHIKPLSLEPMPAGRSYFQKRTDRAENISSDVSATIDATLGALATNEIAAKDNVWSVDELVDMPDVVAALMQNEMHSDQQTQPTQIIDRKAQPVKVQKIEIIQNGSEPTIQVDFQK